MTQQLQQKLSDSATARWLALFIVSLTMMCGYLFTDIMSPLEKLLTEPTQVVYFTDGSNMSEKELIEFASVQSGEFTTSINHESIVEGATFNVKKKDSGSSTIEEKSLTVEKVIPGKHWTADEYGFFSGSYGFINVFLLMLFFGGLILDKMGIRFTGIMSGSLMLVGALIKYYALTHTFNFELLGYQGQVIVACLGFAIFGVGSEITGITVSKVIVKWFTGKELALAMGLQVALARLGTAVALGASLPIAKSFGDVSSSILIGAILLCIGLLIFLVYCVMDKKNDESAVDFKQEGQEEEGFKFSDLGMIFKSPGFWLITLLCLMFYGGVFPFIKFATNLMIFKYGVSDQLAGLIPSVLPFGTILLTPLFGTIYDRVGKGATLMLIGSVMLTIVHIVFALPGVHSSIIAIANMALLGVAFSLVPSAMWPSVPKIIPMKQLGSAFAIIFYIQNIGLSLIPILMGKVIGESTSILEGKKVIDYTLPMSIFAVFGVVAILLSAGLILLDKRKGYGLQDANIEKK